MSTPKWLQDAVFYNVYPQSFYDTNGDGIGDLNGVTAKLDYIRDMGYTVIWMNPVYESPFRDAGYDITDFYKIADRYGTNDDFRHLCEEAHARGIRVVMDLVAGHTSLECEWFQESAKPERNRYSDRYVWTDSVWKKGTVGSFISGYSDRDGCYMNNFFYHQPALNYGYAVVEEPWQTSMDSPAALETRAEMLRIMDFWSDLGADGFRVDMAESLIKNDPDGSGIRRFWQGVRAEFLSKHPDSVMVAEWARPKLAIAAGFHIDHFLHSCLPAYTTLFRYEESANQHNFWIGNSYFRREGKGNLREFLDTYLEHYEAVKGKGYASIPSGDHDIPRLSIGRDTDELFVTHAFLLTMPGVPLIYYGDEIGMRYVEGLASKEGGFNRTGSRTPMQWCEGKNLGFSPSDTPYLPVDSAADAPTVEAQEADEHSLLHHTRKLIRLRRENSALWADSSFEVLYDDYPFVYRRSSDKQTVVVAINPSERHYSLTVPPAARVLYAKGAHIQEDTLCMDGVSFILYEV